MATSPKFIQMIEHLATATEQGRLAWGEDDDDTFLARLTRAMVRISQGRDGDYYVTLYDGTGKVLELETFSSTENKEHYAPVDRLYSLARRDAYKIDEVIDQVILDVSPRR
ncbi:MAG: hypothetical protein JWN86_4258 [Planctomycetota bacterium]|nr:hypothetical protein [Planctomycetota bacterium]